MRFSKKQVKIDFIGKNTDSMTDEELDLIYKAELEVCPSCHLILEYSDMVKSDIDKETLVCKSCKIPKVKEVIEIEDDDQ